VRSTAFVRAALKPKAPPDRIVNGELSPEQENLLRDRSSRVGDKISEFLRAMFVSIDRLRRERDAARGLIDVLVPQCKGPDCTSRATCSEVATPSNKFCDTHGSGKQTKDETWAPALRALVEAQKATKT